jgi:hypothetical protein
MQPNNKKKKTLIKLKKKILIFLMVIFVSANYKSYIHKIRLNVELIVEYFGGFVTFINYYSMAHSTYILYIYLSVFSEELHTYVHKRRLDVEINCWIFRGICYFYKLLLDGNTLPTYYSTYVFHRCIGTVWL